ncbi:MAG: hypothetical protein FWE24_08215 [Defluviitaleaceae bacterium]|nr:hypothetical protein [Defluviitaleaceae bacterium]
MKLRRKSKSYRLIMLASSLLLLVGFALHSVETKGEAALNGYEGISTLYYLEPPEVIRPPK